MTKYISSTLHGVLDYLLAIFCLCFMYVMDLKQVNESSYYVSLSFSIFFIVQALVTQFRPSLIKIIPMRHHLVNDMVAALAFMITPFVCGLTGIYFLYFLGVSLGIIVVGTLTKSNDYKVNKLEAAT